MCINYATIRLLEYPITTLTSIQQFEHFAKHLSIKIQLGRVFAQYVERGTLFF